MLAIASRARRSLAMLRMASIAAASLAAALIAAPAAAQDDALFARLFGADPAAERAGAAADGLALPALFAEGRLIADALPLHDLGAGGGACVAILPLLAALEVAHQQDGGAGGPITLTLPEPRRTLTIPAAALMPSPSGDCLPLAALSRHLPLTLRHDAVSQRLILEPSAALPVLMRLARAERQARLRPETARPSYPLLARPRGLARLWSVDLAASLIHQPQGTQASASLLASGELFGLAARASLVRSGEGRILPGFTLAEARETPDLLGPFAARSLALGDIAAPSQPLIADALAGRGLVVSSRAPWRADLVDEITLSGALPAGWEAELWHEERLVAVTREGDAAGQWQFGGLPVRIGENRWVVRLYGPNGEMSEQVFRRLVGTEMNAENTVEYAFGLIDGGRPLLGDALRAAPAGPAAFATLDWGVDERLTARLDLRGGLAGAPAAALSLNGAHGGALWSLTAARDRRGTLGAALRLARRIGAQDVVVDLARHGADDGPGLPPVVREFAQVMTLSGQGRIGLGRLSLPWQARVQSGALRRGEARHVAAARIVVPMADWQANLALGAVRDGAAPWQQTAALGLTARQGSWRLRSALAASNRAAAWRLDTASLSAARSFRKGAIALDLVWQAERARLDGGITVSQQLGPFALSASAGREGDGWRAGLGVTLGLWRGAGAANGRGQRWHADAAGMTRSGAILAQLFVDEDGDGLRGPDEAPVAGARMIVGAALRREASGPDGDLMIRGLPAGPAVDIETQLASLDDFTLRPAQRGERVALRPGEVRAVAVPLRPTGSLEVQVVLAAGDALTPRAGVPVALRDAAGREVARAVTDFAGYALFDGLAFGRWQAEAAGHLAPVIEVAREARDHQARILIAAAP
jgi:hypothetical protein